MGISFGCAWQRNASVLVWTPVLLLAPLLDLHGGPARITLQVALALTMAVAAVVATLTSSAGEQGRTPYIALSVLAAATVVGATQGGSWLPTWVLTAITMPAVLRARWLAVGLPLVAGGAVWAAWLEEGTSTERMWSQGFIVLLSGVATTAVVRLIDTVHELRRTRGELARRAVAEERERFSRDLHDLLGHTLSVMVVKSEAVRRLVDKDPAAAAAHATDIERVGREALVEVREAVDAMRAATLDDELDGARRALAAAGIETEVQVDQLLPNQADRAFAWVVREGATNVLRHSGATHCRFEVTHDDGQLVLTVADDGVGGPAPSAERQGGLDGLRRRLVAAGGRLEVDPDADGFRLTAVIPHPVDRSRRSGEPQPVGDAAQPRVPQWQGGR